LGAANVKDISLQAREDVEREREAEREATVRAERNMMKKEEEEMELRKS
jgi:hypothetical protein